MRKDKDWLEQGGGLYTMPVHDGNAGESQRAKASQNQLIADPEY
jgi:hypothetical protein